MSLQHEIFISYSRHDSTVANALADTLTDSGYSVWLDRDAIKEGDAFDTQIEEAIAETKVVIVIWSQKSIKSHWVRAEAAYALGKQKLLPILIDQSEPPLQFLQIQTIDFRYWDHNSTHHAFQQLAGAVAKRLERSTTAAAPTATAAASTGTPAAARRAAPANSLKATVNKWLAAAGLRFPEHVIEMEYRDYFNEKTFIIAQFSMALAMVTYLFYGAADMAMASGGVLSTRFRFMVAMPSMALFFALSFRPFAKRHSLLFIYVFGIVGIACTYINVIFIGSESPFRIETGNATMNCLLLMGFLSLLPLSVINTVPLGLIVIAGHAALMMRTDQPLATTWLYHLHANSMLVVACCIAYWREHFYRASFAAELT